MTMTRKDAIKTLRELWRETNNPWYEEVYNMAIEALQADRPSGEWICKGDYAMCSKCGCLSDTQFDGVERIPKTTAFCPNCGADMRGEQDG